MYLNIYLTSVAYTDGWTRIPTGMYLLLSTRTVAHTWNAEIYQTVLNADSFIGHGATV